LNYITPNSNQVLEIQPVKDALIEEGCGNYGNEVRFKKLGKYNLIRTVEGITKDNFVQEIPLVKNAFCFVKDNIFYCKHYDTIIFAFDLKEKKILELYLSCSITSDRQLFFIHRYLNENQLTNNECFTDFCAYKTKEEKHTRGKHNKFSLDYEGDYN